LERPEKTPEMELEKRVSLMALAKTTGIMRCRWGSRARAESIAEAMKQRLKELKSIEVWLESAEEILKSRQATQGRWLKI